MDADIEKRLDKIDTKLDEVYKLQLSSVKSTAQQEIRIENLEKDVEEMKSNKKTWITPAISAAVSALISWIISGGLK